MTESEEYKVNLDVYSGPLELLLYLIRKEEVDIKDIPIARITEQYLHHVEIIRRIDINLAGEFLVMAATLMEIKSRMLIPRPVAPEGVNPEDPAASASMEDMADPRAELVRQLLAYKQFKDAATDLKRRAETEAARYPRAIGKPTGKTPLEIDDLNLFALIDAFNAIMASIGHSAYGHEVVYDDTPITLHQADILDRLEREGQAEGLTLQQLFVGRTRKTEMIGLFLATLELIRQKRIFVEQSEPLGEVRIRLRHDTGEEVLFRDAPPPASTSPATSSAAPPVAEASASPMSPSDSAPDSAVSSASAPVASAPTESEIPSADAPEATAPVETTSPPPAERTPPTAADRGASPETPRPHGEPLAAGGDPEKNASNGGPTAETEKSEAAANIDQPPTTAPDVVSP